MINEKVKISESSFKLVDNELEDLPEVDDLRKELNKLNVEYVDLEFDKQCGWVNSEEEVVIEKVFREHDSQLVVAQTVAEIFEIGREFHVYDCSYIVNRDEFTNRTLLYVYFFWD